MKITGICCLIMIMVTGNISAGETNSKINIIPLPVSMQAGKGEFRVDVQTSFVCTSTDSSAINVVHVLSECFASVCEHKPAICAQAKGKSNIIFISDSSLYQELGKEGYFLQVNTKGIEVKAASPAGWFYAGQTLLQLLRKDEFGNTNRWIIPSVTIKDYPRFAWRGLMLDVSRHFFSKEVILSYIDQMSKYKLNTFHFHLTDNQGWRIEIKSLPELTKVGAWRVSRTGYWKGFSAPGPGEPATSGGYYTQEDIREIVRFAQERNVTIVPEIDVPGHSLALIASYPNLSCTQTPQQVLAGDPWNVSRTNVLCVGNDSVYQALNLVFTELAALFPGEYIHIGGDEVRRNYWDECSKCRQIIKEQHLKNSEELQTWFIEKVARIVKSKGKKVMGWYENLEGGLVPDMAYMSWKDYKGGIRAAAEGHKVVMTPAFFTYLDFYQGDPAMENGPFTVCRLSSCYAFEPEQEGAKMENILGGQGSVFTEQIPNERKLQYMTWPRSMALAEVLWSPKENRNWQSFVNRMEAQFPRFDQAQVKYAEAFYEPVIDAVKDSSGIRIQMKTEVDNLKIYYSFDDCSPDPFYPEYKGEPVSIPKGAHHIRAVSYRNGKQMGRELNIPLEGLIKKFSSK